MSALKAVIMAKSGRANTKTAKKWDVVIVGGGHNGLTAAAYLARAGRSVLVLEKNPVVGGAAVTEEFAPGFRNSVASYTAGLLSPKIIADLELQSFGLRIIERPVPNFWPLDSARGLLMPYDMEGRQRAVETLNIGDSRRLPAFEAMLQTGASIFRDVLFVSPPRVTHGLARPAELATILSLSRKFLGLDEEAKRSVLDLFTKSAVEVLGRWFEDTHVKAAYAFDSVVGSYAPPSAPGSAYVLLHHIFGEVNGKRGVWGHAMGGMGAISQALADAARRAGAVIETEMDVREIAVGGGAAVGVVLADGRHIAADAVASAVPPKLLFSRLLPTGAVDRDLSDRFTHIRSGSGTFRMNVALSELPDFSCRPGTAPADHHGAGIVIGPTLEYIETAYLDARRDGWSRQPVIEMLIPSTMDKSLAPDGCHVASLFVQYVAPHLPEPRSWSNPGEKEAFADRVIATVDAHAPNFARSVIARQVLSPLDLEQRFGLIDGDIFHGQLGLDQLFSMRPVLGYADYHMPLQGLYLCGSGAHPGGGVTGIPGHNAARAILADQLGWRRRLMPRRRPHSH